MKHTAVAIVALALAACQAGPTAIGSGGQNSEIIRGMYDSFGKGDLPAVAAAMAPDVEWNEAENFIYADGNTYIGPGAVVDGVFSRVGADWTGFKLAVSEVIEAGDRVVAFGRFTGRHKATGAPLDAQFAHVWKLDDGKVVQFQQYTDTLQFASVTGRLGKGKANAATAKATGAAPRSKPAQAAQAQKAPAKKKPAKKPKSGR